MTTITAIILIFLGIFSILASGPIENFKTGLSLLIFGMICFGIGFLLFLKESPKPIQIKSEEVINVDSIYLKGYKDGIKDCENK